MAKKKLPEKESKEKIFQKDESGSEDKKNQKELPWIVAIMIGVLLVAIITPMIFKSFSKFNYHGLEFNKEKFGEIPVYRYTYNFADNAGQVYEYNFYVREDPRTNKVPIDAKIEFSTRVPVYISVNSSALSSCSNGLREVASISSFLRDNLLSIKPANIDKTISEENNLTYANCDEHPLGNVVVLNLGDSTKVYQDSECYTIQAKDCDDLLPSVEKFMTESIIQARQQKSLIYTAK